MKKIFFVLFTSAIIITACGPETSCTSDKTIGITYGKIQSILACSNIDINSEYITQINNHGGCVEKISVYDDADDIAKKLKKVKAILIPGGLDVKPSRYNEEDDPLLESVDEKLDVLEFKVLQYAKENKLPVLGICRGHQILNVFYGGSLYQDIPSHYKSENKVVHRKTKGWLIINLPQPCFHDITIQKGSLLHSILGADRINVNSYHHQGVKAVAPGFSVAAKSDDGFIEAIEWKGEPFIIGVQFHPEKMAEERPQFKRIFQEFLNRID